MLSREQITSFYENGYIALPQLLENREVADLVLWTSEVKAWPNRKEHAMPYTETKSDGSVVLCRTENFANFHEGFSNLFRRGKLPETLAALNGEPMCLFKEKINYKEARAGGFAAHIDASAYNHAGPQTHLTFLLAVEAMDLSNGCLEVVKGSHKVAIPLGADRCLDKKWEAGQTWTPVPLPAGGLLIFGSYLAHRSGPNTSDRNRAAIYATYNKASEGDQHDAYYRHRRQLWPPSFERKEGHDYREGAMLYAYGSPMSGGLEAIAEVLAAQRAHAEKVVDELFAMLVVNGEGDYIGESISQLEHSLQAAYFASQDGADEMIVTAALLHDVGQFLPADQATSLMKDGRSVGRRAHEQIGATYLQDLGFPDKVCQLVGAHVVAKRHLTAISQEYYEHLSQASKDSLELQGGPFTELEVAAFKQDPLFEEKVALRRFDDAAKKTDLVVPNLDSYHQLVVQVYLSRRTD